mmetsp:Transcript_132660/g.322343  ORF Transcript_132660/g.322343 Transcript_132660/m.322343 type:complete len:238 (-) Transcript_132660:1043-1756(-)
MLPPTASCLCRRQRGLDLCEHLPRVLREQDPAGLVHVVPNPLRFLPGILLGPELQHDPAPQHSPVDPLELELLLRALVEPRVLPGVYVEELPCHVVVDVHLDGLGVVHDLHSAEVAEDRLLAHVTGRAAPDVGALVGHLLVASPLVVSAWCLCGPHASVALHKPWAGGVARHPVGRQAGHRSHDEVPVDGPGAVWVEALASSRRWSKLQVLFLAATDCLPGVRRARRSPWHGHRQRP